MKNTKNMKKRSPEDPVLGPKMNLKILGFHCKKVFGANGIPKNEPENNEKLEKCAPRRTPFWTPKWTSKCWFFIAKNEVFGANGVPKNEPEKVKKPGSQSGPMLLPSVAPEGTPPAMLLKKLAFGTSKTERSLRG